MTVSDYYHIDTPFDWATPQRPIIALAPMAGYTDTAYRRVIKRLCPRAIVFSEFVSSDALHYNNKKTKRILEFHKAEEYPFIGQIFGKKPANFADAAKWIESIGASGVDINMGCPAKKVVSSDHGSALLDKPELAEEIVRATVDAVKIPVSVKMRVGVRNSENTVEFAKRMEAAGAKLLTIHGRTAKQMYTGKADYEPIYAVKRAVSVPVIGNGDILTADDYMQKLGNLDGLMIGRGTVGNPWLMAEIAAKLEGREFTAPRTLRDRLPMILLHCRLASEYKGEAVGIREMRKYLIGYVRAEPGARDLRVRLVQASSYAEVETLLNEFIAAGGGVSDIAATPLIQATESGCGCD